nr:MarR family transcriptional regulator [uncultured Mediterraneibacter sp.]
MKYGMKDQVRQFCDAWQELNMIYEDYARSIGVPYTSLYILSLITKIDGCTQKTICEKTFLPRQTVNTIITGFYKKRWIILQELPEDRRTKTIHLTEDGKEYARKIIPQIQKAELEAMEKLTEEQRKALLEGIRIYRDAFRAAMLPTEKM